MYFGRLARFRTRPSAVVYDHNLWNPPSALQTKWVFFCVFLLASISRLTSSLREWARRYRVTFTDLVTVWARFGRRAPSLSLLPLQALIGESYQSLLNPLFGT